MGRCSTEPESRHSRAGIRNTVQESIIRARHIVPGKPANKAGQPVAEPVEGRGGAGGNAGLQSTVRTQSRAAVSQAQARLREAVTRNKKEKLTALLHHITIDLLRAAFFALKRRAAPGIDAVTWDMYEERREENLRDLH